MREDDHAAAARDPATAARIRRARRTALIVAAVALALFVFSIAQMWHGG